MSHSRRTVACRLEVRAWKVKKKERTGQPHPPPKHRIIKGLAAVIGVIVVASMLGNGIGTFIKSNDAKTYLLQRDLRSAQITEGMGTIRVGLPLSNHYFSDFDGKSISLQDVVNSPSFVMFVDYQCNGCLAQLEEIRSAAKDSEVDGHLVLISSNDPILLKELTDSLLIRCPILFDENREYTSSLAITTFPFTVTVDSALNIQRVTAGILLSSEIRNILKQYIADRA